MQWLLIFTMVLILIYFLSSGKGFMTGSPVQNFANSKQEFIQKFGPIAKKISQEYNIDPNILITQAGHETGWGSRVIDNNFFGIKATDWWKKIGRDTIRTGTHEYIPGKGKIFVPKAEWRAYSSPEESIRDFIRLIKNLPRYSKAWANRNNYKKFFEELQKGGYATDPKYADKLKNLYETIV